MVLMKLFAGQQWRHREETCGHGGEGQEAEGGMYGDSNKETYIPICKIANGNLPYDSGTQPRAG